MAHIFISYAHKDRLYARTLADHLLAHGFDLWIDDRIDFGSNWERAIFKAIDDCGAIIVIMTTESYESIWVQRERQHAERRGKPAFPLLLAGEVFPFYGVLQYYDVRDGKLPDHTFLGRLSQVIQPGAAPGQDVAAAPQQRAKVELETSEVKKVEQDSPAPPAQAADQRARQPRRGSFLMAALAVVVAIALVIVLAVNMVNNNGASVTPTVMFTQESENTPGQVAAAPSDTPTVTRPTATFTLTPSAAITSAPTPFGGGQGQIAFVSDRDGNDEIYVIDVDGRNAHNLTDNPADDSYPVWSPDGAQIAFASDRGNPNSPAVYVMDADGSNVRRVLSDTAGWNPAWSPDGTQIAFPGTGNVGTEIYVVAVDGSNLHALTNDSVNDDYPAWSPDGSQIVFVSERDGNQEIYLMDADGSNVRRLTNNPADDNNPAWSPDGTRIAFQGHRGDYAQIGVINGDGSDLRYITSDSEDAFEPAWSPDGTQIVFASYRDSNGGAELYVMGTDGTNARRLTDNPAEDRYAAWRP